MADDPYAEYRARLTAAGFYSPATESMGSWNRIIPCTEGPPEFSGGFGGRSFWVACVDEVWYVGTWGSYIYRLPEGDRLFSLTGDFLRDESPMYDFSPELKEQYGLVELDEFDSERILPDQRLLE